MGKVLPRGTSEKKIIPTRGYKRVIKKSVIWCLNNTAAKMNL